MPKSAALYEYQMPAEIRKLVVGRGFVAPPLADVSRALTYIHNREPERFSSESSRAVVVQDVAGGFIARNEKAKKNRGEKRSPKGDITTYPPGYEYSVLIASQIRSQIEDIRERIWLTREVPFASYDEATNWMRVRDKYDHAFQQSQPQKIELHLELAFEGLEDKYAYMQDINKFPNQEEKDGFETWLKESGKALREAVLHNAWVENGNRSTLKIGSRSEVRHMQFGSTTVLRGQYSPDSVEQYLVRGGLLEDLLIMCEAIAEAKAPGWTADDVFTYLVLGYLPLSPIEATLNYSGGLPYGYTYTFSYPILEKTLLNTHREFTKHNHEKRLGYFKAYPKPLSEHELNLLNPLRNSVE